MEQPTPKEPRGPINLRIKFRSESIEQFIERYSIDVSRGGIFIRTREPLAVGTQLKFDFQLQDAAPLMAGEGTVVWIREHDPNRAGVTPGMGVRFDKLTPTSQPVLEKILLEKGRRDQSAAVAAAAGKAGTGMAVRRGSSTFTALDPAVTGSGPVGTGASPSSGPRSAAPLERTNVGYAAPSTPAGTGAQGPGGQPPQMTLPLSSPPKGPAPDSSGGRAGSPTGAGLGMVSRLTPAKGAKYEPPTSSDIDKALDGLTPGGDVTAGISASSGSGPTPAKDSAVPSGVVDPMSEPTQIADRLPDFFGSGPTRMGGPEPKSSLDARLSTLNGAGAVVEPTSADKPKDAGKPPAIETAAAATNPETKPATPAQTAAAKRPMGLIVGGVVVAALVAVVAATSLTSSDDEQEASRARTVESQPAVPSPEPAPAPAVVPPTEPQAPVAAEGPAAPAAAAPEAEASPPATATAESAPTATERPSRPAKTTPAARKPAAVARKSAGTTDPATKPADAPAEAQAPRSSLRITSTPAGADVSIDGQSVGKTPYQGKEIDAATAHAITVKLDGYEPFEQMISASDWTKGKNNVQSAKVSVKLRKVAGSEPAKPSSAATEPAQLDSAGAPAPVAPSRIEPTGDEALAPTTQPAP